MPQIISPEYLALNKHLHAEEPHYGAHGDHGAAHVVKMARDNRFKSILDYGCGKGSMKPAILKIAPEMTVYEFDPAIEGKDVLPTVPIDFLIAMDVMEHIEPDYLDSVFETMRDLRPRLVMLQIALTKALKTLPDGRNAHLIVELPEWWMARAGAYFKQEHIQVTPSHLIYYGTPL